MPDHYDKPSGLGALLPSFPTPTNPPGTGTVGVGTPYPFAGIFNSILQNSAQRALMETEGMYTAAEAAFETAQRDLRDIQMTVPQEQQAEKLAEYLRRTGYSSDIVTQTLGIPKAEVNAALMAGGFDATGTPLPEGNVTETTIPPSTIDVSTIDSDQPSIGPLPPLPQETIDKASAGDEEARIAVIGDANDKGLTVGQMSEMYGEDDDPNFFDELLKILMGMTNNADAIGILGRSNLPAQDAGANNAGDSNGSDNTGNNNQPLGNTPTVVTDPSVTVDAGPAIGPQPNGATGSGDGNDSGAGTIPMPGTDVFPEGGVVIDDQPKGTDQFVSLPQRPAQTGLLAMVTTPQIVPAVMSEPSKLFEPMSFEMNNVSQYSGLIRRLLA